MNVDLQAGRNKRYMEHHIKQQKRATKNYLPLSEYMVDMNKRRGGDDLLLKTYNVTSDVVSLFAIAESIDSVVSLLERVEREFQRSEEHDLTESKYFLSNHGRDELRIAGSRMKKFPENIRQSSEHFSPFEGSPKHHPYHLHKTSLTKLSQEMEQASTSFHTLYNELPPRPCEQNLVWTSQCSSKVKEMRKHINESTIPALSDVAKKVRALITPPQVLYSKKHTFNEALESLEYCNGTPSEVAKKVRALITTPPQVNPVTLYSKTHAINEALKYCKGTPERGAAIKDMVRMGCVPSKTAFYDAINIFEKEGGNVMIDSWNMEKGPVRKRCLRKMGSMWLAHICMPAIPVDCDFYSGNPILDKDSILELYKTPRIVDISDYMGLTEGTHKKVGIGGRIYFSPHQFPTPLNLAIAGSANDKVFQLLKKCIQKYCEDAGSPVVCNGGKAGSKKFVCSHKMRARKQKLTTDKRYTCPYSFTVKWDKLGYFIPLRNRHLKRSTCFVGCEYHNHE
jgi:hypothetical protein